MPLSSNAISVPGLAPEVQYDANKLIPGDLIEAQTLKNRVASRAQLISDLIVVYQLRYAKLRPK